MEDGNRIKLKVPAASKTKQWVEDIVMFAGDTTSMYSSDNVRAKVQEGIINLDLYNGKLHPSDLVLTLNPRDLQTIDTSRSIRHYPIAAPNIDLLVGEELNGNFEPGVEIVNNIGIEEKEERYRAYVESEIDRLLTEAKGDEELVRNEVKKLKNKLKYTYKDVVEKKASALLAHYDKELNFKEMFIEGYRRAFNLGEEAYEIENINGRPVIRVINTLQLRLYGGGNSTRMEDYDMITIEDHFPPGYLIDRYGAELTKEEVEDILNYQTGIGKRFDTPYGDATHEFVPVGSILGTELASNLVDNNGGIRHLRVRFKAYKQIKKVLYQDPMTGENQIKVRDDKYKLGPGEVLDSKIWISEWWIASLIGYDIVVDAHPIPIRYNKLSELTEGHPGIVGEVYNINEKEAIPIMTRMKPWQYWYDVTIDSIITAMSKNIGPILEMDMAKRPKNWDTMQWLHYITKYNVKFIDSFKEIERGPAKGQLAGNLASGRDQQLNQDFGNYIQQLINIAEYIEMATAEIIGLTPQRKGAVQNRETFGGIERATSQSAHITEWYSFKHEQVKLRALNVFIEAAKDALKDNPRKLQTMVDSFTREMLTITEEDFANSDLGVFVTNSKKLKENKLFLEQAAQAYMQNGGEFSFIFNVMYSNSMAEKRRLIETKEEENRESQQAAREQEMKMLQQEAAATEASKQKDRDMEKYKADLDAVVKIKLKEMEMLQNTEKITSDKEISMEDMKARILELQAEMETKGTESVQRDRELDIEEKKVAKQNAAAKK